MGLIPYVFSAAIPTALVWWGQWKAKRVTKPMIKEIHHQVKNSHKTNLREDMDRIEGLLADGFSRVDRQLEGLRDDLRTERLERIAGDARGH